MQKNEIALKIKWKHHTNAKELIKVQKHCKNSQNTNNDVRLMLNICKDSVLWSNLRFLLVCLENTNNETKEASF